MMPYGTLKLWNFDLHFSLRQQGVGQHTAYGLASMQEA
jgi:hypothetical protein